MVPLMRRCSLGRSSGSDRQLVTEGRIGWWAVVLTNLVPTGAWERWRFARPAYAGHGVTCIFQLPGNLLVKQQIRLSGVSWSVVGMITRYRGLATVCRNVFVRIIRIRGTNWAIHLGSSLRSHNLSRQILQIDDVAGASGGTFDSIWIKYRGRHQPGCFLRFDLSLMQLPQYKNKSFFIEPTHIGQWRR